MKMYKGFNNKLQCTPGDKVFQYEVGKTYKESDAKLCSYGFHACENPMNVFRYYSPANSRYCEVNLDGLTDQEAVDSKRCGTKLTVGAEIGIPGLVKAHVEWVKDNLNDSIEQQNNTGDYSAATNTGCRSAATNTGDYSAATNTGNCSAATNTGNCSAATNTGNYSAATNTGNYSVATNTGNCSAAEVSGKKSVAIVTGYQSKVRGKKGCWLVLAERDDNLEIINMISVKVDGELIKEDTWYRLVDGKLEEEYL